jgi:hypothetical protein
MNRYELTYGIYCEAHNWAVENGYDNGYFWDADQNVNEASVMRWLEAITVCNYLSLIEGFMPVYYGKNEPFLSQFTNGDIHINWKANGYRLPTEAEWEYAARGGKISRGYIYAGGNNIDEVAWYTYQKFSRTFTGIKKPNELGIFDMSGNASEWCIDIWNEPAKMEPEYNPNRVEYYSLADIIDDYRVLKGGHISSYGNYNMDGDIDYFVPQFRIQAYTDREDSNGKQYEYMGTIRLVRNKNGVKQ